VAAAKRAGERGHAVRLADLNKALPNGFHDAKFHRIEIDYGNRRVKFESSLWTGDETDSERREAGNLVLDGFAFISLDRPNPRHPFVERGSLWVDHCEPPEKLPEGLVPKGHFASAFFVNEWNAFIVVVARDAQWESSNPPRPLLP
jgi:hypothetical protein